MSTELYFQIEVTSTKNYPRLRWCHFARVRLSQDNLLFAILGSVRRDEFADMELQCQAPKGLPDDVAEASLEEDAMTIDEGAKLEACSTCCREDAEEWVQAGQSRYLNDGEMVTHPEFYSHSWATIEELEQMQQRYQAAGGGPDEALLGAVIAMMNSLQQTGHLSRAIFWFG